MSLKDQFTDAEIRRVKEMAGLVKPQKQVQKPQKRTTWDETCANFFAKYGRSR